MSLQEIQLEGATLALYGCVRKRACWEKIFDSRLTQTCEGAIHSIDKDWFTNDEFNCLVESASTREVLNNIECYSNLSFKQQLDALAKIRGNPTLYNALKSLISDHHGFGVKSDCNVQFLDKLQKELNIVAGVSARRGKLNLGFLHCIGNDDIFQVDLAWKQVIQCCAVDEGYDPSSFLSSRAIPMNLATLLQNRSSSDDWIIHSLFPFYNAKAVKDIMQKFVSSEVFIKAKSGLQDTVASNRINDTIISNIANEYYVCPIELRARLKMVILQDPHGPQEFLSRL